MIRLATLEDKKALINLAKSFMQEGVDWSEFNRTSLDNIAEFCLNDTNGLAVVYERDSKIVGMLLGMLSEHPMFGYTIATELCWYVDPSYRGGVAPLRLIKAFTEWAEFRQAEYMVVADIPKVKNLSNFYTKLGFEPAERAFMRKV